MRNNILYKNAVGQSLIYFSGAGTQDFSYNDFFGNTTTTDVVGITQLTGNLAADPIFDSNFVLGTGSSCIDSGDPNSAYNDTDGTRNDMGIYGGPDPFTLSLS